MLIFVVSTIFEVGELLLCMGTFYEQNENIFVHEHESKENIISID